MSKAQLLSIITNTNTKSNVWLTIRPVVFLYNFDQLTLQQCKECGWSATFSESPDPVAMCRCPAADHENLDIDTTLQTNWIFENVDY